MKNYLFIFFLSFLGKPYAQNLSNREINTDYTIVKGPTSRVWQVCVGADRANEGLRADWQQQLTEVQKNLAFKYIRFHGLLQDDMGVYKEDLKGNPIYNWQYIDKLYDFLLSVKIRPMVEFSFMPSALATDPTPTVFWWRGVGRPPKDYNKWSALITELVKHFEKRYGHEEIKQWLFEVWNEPNIHTFWASDRNEYFKLYASTVNAIKAVSPELKVGGPATSGSTWLKEFFTYCKENNVPFDYVSTHSYGSGGYLDEYGTHKQGLRGSNEIPKDIAKARMLMDSLQYHIPLHISEWNSSSGPKDARHDTYQNAAFVLHVLRHTENASSMSYWTFTDIFEEPGPQVTPFHGGFGMINLQGIKKPTYYAYKFLSQLGETELKNEDQNSYVCKDKLGNLQILCWDFKAQPDITYANNFFDNGTNPESQGTISIHLKHAPNGNYKISLYQTGYQHNDPLNAYKEMGSPYNIDREQEKKLKEISSGEPILQKIIQIKNGLFNYQINVKSKDVYFLKLVKQK